MVKISELKPGMNGINLKAKVTDLSEPREIMTKFGSVTTLTEATLEDDSGSIKLVLWGDQSKDVKNSTDIEVTNAFTKEFRDVLQLGIGKGGSAKSV